MTISFPSVADQRSEENRVDHEVSDDPKPILRLRRLAAAHGAGALNVVVRHCVLPSRCGAAA